MHCSCFLFLGDDGGGGGGNVVHWPITTKYYRADMALHLAETDEQPAEEVEEGNALPLVAHGEDLQGLILLCEASVHPHEEPDAQLARLKPWYGVECGPRVCDVCLCVSVCLLVLMTSFPHRIQDGRCLVPGRAGAVPGRGCRGRRGSSGRGRGRGRGHATKTTPALVRKWPWMPL